MGVPASSTPPRRPGSVRRTTTHDSLRHDGLLGPVTVDARGRDLFTDLTGAATVLSTARLDVEISFPDRAIIRIAAEPSLSGLQSLVGSRASAGFRQALDDAVPGQRASRSVRFQLLDDLPTAVLVSGYAIQASRIEFPIPRGPMLQHPDLCAGWVTGGTLLSGMAESGMPPLRIGPVAPPVDAADAPLDWHEASPLQPHGMRRRRRLDVWEEAGVAMIECFFRDSHMGPAHVETVVHEYTVRATVDPSTLRFLSCEADVGALPYPECPGAAASAGRLRGTPVDDLRGRVRDTFVGASTCTHLNDTLRSLEDVGGLLAALREAGESMRR